MRANKLTVIRDSPAPIIPALVAGAGERAALRFLEFFTVNIRNKNTRKAYARAAASFLCWCEAKGIDRLQRVAGHSNAKTTGLYDRRNDDISVSEVERVGI